MPKEKKSAASAIRPAVSAARGSSIMVPIGMSRRTPSLGGDLGEHRVGLVADQVQLHHRPDQRHHDLHLRVAAGLDPVRRRLRRPRGPASRTARARQPQPHPAQPEHRVGLVQPLDRGQQLLVVRGVLAALPGHGHLDGQLGAVGQELVQRRVEQPDRHRQPVHRLEQLDEVVALQRQQRVQRRRRAPRRRRPAPAARSAPGARRGTCARCGTARCPARRAGGRGRRRRRCRRWPAPAAAGPRRRG